MGRQLGSGRKACHEELIRIDVRKSRIHPWSQGQWYWTVPGGDTVSVEYEVSRSGEVLLLKVQPENGGLRQFGIELYKRELPNGGRFWLMFCPQCGKRRMVLYLVHGACLCKQCGDVYHRVENEPAWGRKIIKRDKILDRLGGGWTKPKWQRTRTYQRLVTEADRLDDEINGSMYANLGFPDGPLS